MASYTLSPIGGAGWQFFDNNGVPLAGGKIYTYAAGTTTLQTTWTTPSGSTANANPIVLDSAGRPPQEIWLDVAYSYKFVIETSAGILIRTYDNIPGLPQPPIVNDASGITYEQGNTVAAGAFVVGQTYMIASVGSTDFISIGALANSVGTLFVASGVGSGTGTAFNVQTVEDKLRQYISVKDFGAVGDGVADDTAAIQAALTYAYNAATGPSWRRDTPQIYFPYGNYRVAQPNALFAGLQFYTGKLVGDGKSGGSQITYDVPAAGANDYLIYNNDYFGFIQFEGFRFASANIAANQNFMYYYSTGKAQNFSFNECEFSDFSQIFNVQGPANASENTFINCKFNGFSDCAFRLNNSQSINWRFYACEAEIWSGTLFELSKGTAVLWSQGSIIPTASTARIIKIPAGADPNAFGPSNSPHIVFHNARFEMRDGSLMVEKLNSPAYFFVVYDTCGMGGLNVPDPATDKMFTWAGSGIIEMRGCSNLTNYRFDHTVPGSQADELYVKMDTCIVPTDVITDSTFTVTGGGSANVGYGPLFNVSGCGSRIDGVYRINDTQFMNNVSGARRGVVKQKHAIAFSPEASIFAIAVPGTVYDVYIPPSRVIEAEFFPVAVAGFGSTQATVTITNAAGTVTLATFTWTMDVPASVRLSSDCNYFVDSLNGDYLKITVSHNFATPVAGTFKGQLYLTY